MNKNEIAKNIRKNLKKVFGKTMKFSVTSRYAGSTPSITITIKEAHEDYFKTLPEYEHENQHLKYDKVLYNSLIKKFKANNMCALTDEVIECITYLGNEFNSNSVEYYLTIKGVNIIKIY